MSDGFGIEVRIAVRHDSDLVVARGLPGARRLMDEFEIESTVGGETRVTLTKWAPVMDRDP